jgi:Na+/melibiose symporter-like transporter
MTSRLTPVQLAVFSLPVMLFQAVEIAWRTYLPAFLSQEVGLSLGLVGTLLLAARLFDAAAGPAVGLANDHLAGVLGRRGTWMLLGAPLVSAGAIGLFTATSEASLALIIGCMLALHLGYVMIGTPHGGWGLEIGVDGADRTRIQAAKVWLAAVGGALLLLVLGVAERGYAATRSDQMLLLATILSVLAPLSVGPLVRLVREPERCSPARPVTRARSLRAVLGDGDLAAPLCLYMLTGIAEGASGAMLLFFVEDGLDLHGWASSLAFIQSLMMIVALPLWVRWSRRLGRYRVLLAIYAWQTMAATIGFALPSGSPAVAAAFLILRYATGAGEFVLLRAITADAVARNAAKGVRTAASIYAIVNVVLMASMGAGAAAAMTLLAHSGYGVGQSSGMAQQLAIRLIYLLPTALAGASACLLLVSRRTALPMPTATACH